MRKTRPLVLCCAAVAAALTGGCGPAADETLEQPSAAAAPQALSIYTENPTGNLSVLAPDEDAPVDNNPGVWAKVPGLSSGVYSRAGDNLEITVSAEVYVTGAVWLRARVDGVVAKPADVQFKAGTEHSDGTRSFTFVQPNVSGGQHVVEIEWYTGFGSTASIRDRTLAVQSASPTFGTGRLAVAVAPSGPDVTKSTSAWEDIPGLATTLTTQVVSNLAITLSAESNADAGRLFARALVDGTAVSDVLFIEAGNSERRGTRAYTFLLSGLPAGAHSVRLQWSAQGGQVRIGDRTAAVTALPAVASGGGQAGAGRQLAPSQISSTSWVDIPSASIAFSTAAPTSSAVASFGAEVSSSGGRLFLRPLLDGQPMRPANVTLIQGGAPWRTASYSFALKNLGAGAHSLRFQAMVDGGTTASIGDRFVRVLSKRRSGSELAQPMAAMAPQWRRFPTLVLCFDPLRPAHGRPSNTQLTRMLEGQDGGPSMSGWFAENSGGQIGPGPFRYAGCSDNAWPVAPGGRQGNWYWDNDAFELMWQDAIRAADAAVDFHSYDANHDNRLTPDELVLVIVRPQSTPYGTVRSTSVAVDGNATPMGFTFAEVYLSSVDSRRVGNVGLLSHEISHLVLGAWDLYGCPSTTQPGRHSIMDDQTGATHLDPLHKLKNGMVTPDLLDLSSWSSRVATLGAVETLREVTLLYHPARQDREYFILENRWRGAGAPYNYDGPLVPGIVAWHMVEDRSLAMQYPPPGGASCPVGRNVVRKVAVLSSPGQAQDLQWADGSTAGVRVTAIETNDERADVQLSRLN